jgi:hypothetical protein
MTVYVDDMRAEFFPPHAPGRRFIMCHMIADTEEELHAMAARIGVACKWHQGEQEITWREAGERMRRRRRGA